MQVKFYATLRELLGATATDLPLEEPASARAVLAALTARYPALAPKVSPDGDLLAGQVTVLLNGRALQFLNGLDTTVKPDDMLALFPPIGGG
jgi:molybdopterin synthase sulfur carrier subunit